MIPNTRATVWLGYILSGLVILFMIFDAAIKLVPIDAVIASSTALGLPATAGFARGLGMLALACTALYAFPRTSVLGAVLLTGYLGGAVATHVRVSSPVFSHVLFGVYLGILLWGGLYLRDERLRAIFPARRS
ncbi:DoxX family protein [Taklimakanibacter lacteus]|uniref:DoxX family protein n=1 Tax=Taklimakanibacter lacteus TaxID=2268456 RepID=UPI0013C45FCA